MPPNQGSIQLAFENDDFELLPTLEARGYRTTPILFVNGKRVPAKIAAKARPNQTLLSFLRDDMLLTGSKLGCAEGGCGACTVLVSKKEGDSVKHLSVNACLMPVLAADGCHVTTIEGIGTVKGDNLHPIQKAMVELHGSQCGFCTPGIIVAIYGLFANNPTTSYVEEHLDGNLCRCTGYRPIWDAAKSLCADSEEVHGPCGTPCRECPEREECEMECNVQDKAEEKKSEDASLCCSSTADKVASYKEAFKDSQWLEQPETMFPTDLKDSGSAVSALLEKPLAVIGKSEFHKAGTWFKPTTLEEMLSLVKQFGGVQEGGCKIVVGNTEVGIEARFKHAVYPRLISPAESIVSLFGLKVTEETLEIGSCTPLSKIQHECGAMSENNHLQRTGQPIHDMLRWFASTQIRNVACLGGNLVTASPISDMNPMLAAMGAKLILSTMEEGGAITRRSVLVKDFFLRYRTVDLAPTEIVEYVEVPLVKKQFEYVKPFKQARRREDDISIVTSGMKITLSAKDGKWMIDDVCISFGGMAPKTILAPKTMDAMKGQEFSPETFAAARAVLMGELKLPVGVPGGQPVYRLTLAASFLHKFYAAVAVDLAADVAAAADADLPSVPVLSGEEKSATFSFVGAKKPSISGTQKFPEPKVTPGLEKSKPIVKETTVGKPSPHMSGPFHCTGEAIYTDDIPLPPQTLEACLVLSKQCGCVLEGMDLQDALTVPGVIGVYTAKDIEAIGGSNIMGPVIHDELVFFPIGEKIRTVGQVLGIAVAETLEAAEEAARLVDVSYGPVDEKIITTIEDAVAAGSFYEMTRHKLASGDMDAVANIGEPTNIENPQPGDHVVVHGSFRLGGQEHFYLETNSTLVVPSESDTNLTVYCSTQATAKTQNYCASSTGTPASKVVVRMKRMGGGFGGKETRSVFASCAAAVGAKVSGRPVRLTLPRDVDMSITGGRHGFLAVYKASAKITDDGTAKIVSADIQMYSNGGWALDLSGPVMDRALFHIDACYKWPNYKVVGIVCKTVHPNHTAYRGFGGPQGISIGEHIIDHLATACNVRVEKMRRDNMYKTSDATHFGMILDQKHGGRWNVPTMWDRCATELKFDERVASIAEFNSKNKWLKKGIALVPTKFGIAFTAKFMNQGGALVHVYLDGTVLVSHGGTEMGQGLHTKVCQVAAQAFGIPLEDVYVNDSSTDKVANAMPTAASMSTDLYGMATFDACRQILARLQPFRDELGPEASLKEVANKAHFERVDLSAHGFFTLDDKRCGFDWDKDKPDGYDESLPDNSWKGHPFNYFTQGVVCTEVEIDVCSGNHRTVRSDVLVDVGSSINPMIDIGQIEGAFTQGMGWSTMEELIYGDDDHPWIRPKGKVFTAGPGTYKIPAFNDVPETFNVTLLENAANPFAVHSSKAIGEPPFFLGASVFFAIKDAVKAARQSNGYEGYFEMRMPATSERIRMLCGDEIAKEATYTTMASPDHENKSKEEMMASYQPFGSY